MSRHEQDPQGLRFAHDLAKIHELRKAYEKLVPEVLETAERPQATVRHITALFTDIRGFTRLGERLTGDPRFLLEVLNAHLAVVVRSIGICGGVTEKFAGDGVMATFGARFHEPDHSERAIAAAIGVIGANEALNRRREADWGFRLKVGVGVASGRVVVGAIGPPERWELGVIGDPVNIAARLASRARGDDILMTDTVYRDVASKLKIELTNQTAVRGRAGSLVIYRLSLLRSVRSRSRRAARES